MVSRLRDYFIGSRTDNSDLGAAKVSSGILDTNLSAFLGITGVVELDALLSSCVIQRRCFRYFEQVDPSSGHWIVGTRWGCGYRLTITLSDVSAEVNGDLAWISAAAELNIVKASMSLRVFGIDEPGILRNLPTPTSLGRNLEAELEALEQDLDALVFRTDVNLTPAPFEILTYGPLPRFDTPAEYDEQSVVYALLSIANRTSLNKTLKNAKDSHRPEAIRLVYGQIAGSEKPNAESAARAKELCPC